MGTVWMSDQTEPVKRRVAVKLVRMERRNTILTMANCLDEMTRREAKAVGGISG